MIKIIAVGRLKEDFYEKAAAEYQKRLSAYSKVKVIEVADEKCAEKISEKEAEAVREKEAERILKNIRENDYVITLEIKGKETDSEGFAALINKLNISARSDITFVIGGSTGIARCVSQRADFKLSFSKMTFPHMLMRVILLEQIYRAYKIIRNEPYHK